MKKLLTTKEAAELLNVSIHTIYKYVVTKKIPHKKIGTKTLFCPDELLNWVDGKSVSESMEADSGRM